MGQEHASWSAWCAGPPDHIERMLEEGRRVRDCGSRSAAICDSAGRLSFDHERKPAEHVPFAGAHTVGGDLRDDCGAHTVC